MIRRPPESTLLTHPFPTRRSADLFRRVHRSQLGARLRRAGHRSAGNQVLLHRRRDRRLKRETAGGGQRPPPQRQGGALRAPPFSLVLPWALAMGAEGTTRRNDRRARRAPEGGVEGKRGAVRV